MSFQHVRAIVVTVILLTLVGTSAYGRHIRVSENERLISRQREYFQSIRDRRFEILEEMIASEYRGVYRLGMIDKSKELADLRQFPLKDFSISDENIIFVSKKAAILSFRLHVIVTTPGSDVTEDDNITCVWKKTGKKWLLLSQTAVKSETVGMTG